MKNSNNEITLTGKLEEFRIALIHEIDAATNNASSSAVQLINGRKIAQIGGSFQYIFDIENALNLPGDTPGDLYVPGKNPIEVVIISIEGLAITLSIPENLGNFVPNARLQSNLVFLMRKLIERIESKTNIPNPVGERILGNFTDEEIDISEISSDDLNKQQNAAVASSLKRNITFIGGPPGTGKTMTIGSIGKELYRTNRTTLLVSHTNTAVDGALKRIGKLIDNEELNEGKVIRVGDPKDPTLDKQLLLSYHVEMRSAKLAIRKQELEDNLVGLVTKAKEVSKTLDICEWVIEAQEDISSMEKELNILSIKNKNLEVLREELRENEEWIDFWIEAAKAAEIAQDHLEKISGLKEENKKIEIKKRLIEKRLNDISEQFSKAELLLREVENIGWVTRKWRRLPSVNEQLTIVERLKGEFGKTGFELDEINNQLEKAQSKYSYLNGLLEVFQNKYNQDDPKKTLHHAKEHQNKIKDLQQRINEYVQEYGVKYSELQNLFEERLYVLVELGIAHKDSDNLGDMFEAIKNAFTAASILVKDIDVEKLGIEKKELNSHIQSIHSELKEIEEALKKVEELVIKDASIVATTLTRAYLKDSIQTRRFDTVILDEASMAPIPALWIAASIAEKNAVVVGDPKQLPPIVLSSHALSQKWLGHDIFEIAGLDDGSQHFCLVDLKRQYRMHPEISSIPNELFYCGELEDDDRTKDKGRLSEWYSVGWEHDYPVLLVNTASVDAWVTSVPRIKGSSRLNFLSATICIDIVELILNDNRKIIQDGEPPRVLVTCPYRPHAQLLELLIHEQKLENEVVAGTIHSFQGSEADVVVYDLVNDEPHWKVAMFMPSMDNNIKKLLNVALTRAKHRLIIVGDFEYIIKCAKKAFIGAKLLPFLLDKFPVVDSLDIIKSGLAARAAKAQATVFGGDIETTENRIIVTQDYFFRYLRTDFAHARFRIVMYSPFITEKRVAELEPQLRAAIERGVNVYIVTKPYCDRSKREMQQYRMLENTLTKWGAVIIHKQRMHEKLIFIDDSILWEGSLNPLSFKDTEEHMERRVSKKVFSDYARTLHLSDLIGEYDQGSPKCPICGKEVIACEGKDEPFFWRCIEKDCYTRSIDQPALQGGVIKCNKCGGEVEYGEWGGKPTWRCIENRHHHQRLARTHLKLPKMRAGIPKRKLVQLDKLFGLSPSLKNEEKENGKDQYFLFE